MTREELLEVICTGLEICEKPYVSEELGKSVLQSLDEAGFVLVEKGDAALNDDEAVWTKDEIAAYAKEVRLGTRSRCAEIVRTATPPAGEPYTSTFVLHCKHLAQAIEAEE